MIESFKTAVEPGTVKQIQNVRQHRFTHILVLREVESPVQFTSDGERLTTTPIRVGTLDAGRTREIRAVDMFHRKQPGAERRIAKSIQRDLLGDGDDDIHTTDRMHPNEMEQNSVESVLFGSAAGNEGISQKSRVVYNTAYSLRETGVISRQCQQNASGDEVRNTATEEQGTWKPGFVQPGAYFPSVVTLDSATPEEVLFVLAVLNRTVRYGASESRDGRVNNRILDVYSGRADTPSNLELTKQMVAELAEKHPREYSSALDEIVTARTLPPEDVIDVAAQAYHSLVSAEPGEIHRVPDDTLSDTLTALDDDSVLRGVLQDQREKVAAYIDRYNTTDD